MPSYLISKVMDGRIEVQRGWERDPVSDDELMAEQGLELTSSNLHTSYSFASDYMAVWWGHREELWVARLGNYIKAVGQVEIQMSWEKVICLCNFPLFFSGRPATLVTKADNLMALVLNLKHST